MAIQTRIKASRIEMSDRIKDYIEKKVGMLEKYLGDFPVRCADFEIEKTTNHHQKGEIYRAVLNLDVPGELLRVERTEADLFKAIDKVKDHMAEAIKKYKEKKR